MGRNKKTCAKGRILRGKRMNAIKTDTSAIPGVEVKLLCQCVLGEVEVFYKDPHNLQKFEAWMASREEKKEEP